MCLKSLRRGEVRHTPCFQNGSGLQFVREGMSNHEARVLRLVRARVWKEGCVPADAHGDCRVLGRSSQRRLHADWWAWRHSSDGSMSGSEWTDYRDEVDTIGSVMS